MKYLKIQNSGVLDIRLVALMGGTTKANDKYKIGQFGTGLKYTLAYLLRNNIDFKIFCGTTEVKITVEKEVIKDTEFEIICIDGQRSSITTGMGQQWGPWMIVRELWCNALDEGDGIKDVVYDDGLIGVEEKTTFYIQMMPEIQDVLSKWNAYFIQGKVPMWENEEYAIHANKKPHDNLKLYKNGILIYQDDKQKSLFSYDIKKADINELREFRGLMNMEIFHALKNPNNEVVTYFLNNITEEMYEGCDLNYDWFTSFANIWKETIGNQRLADSESRGYYAERGVPVDFSNVIELPKRVYKALVKSFNNLGALTTIEGGGEFFEVPNTSIERKVTEAVQILASAGYAMNTQVKIIYGLFRQENQTYASDQSKKTIMISEACSKMTLGNLILMLVEENEFITANISKLSSGYTRHFVSMFVEKIIPLLSVEPVVEQEEVLQF